MTSQAYGPQRQDTRPPQHISQALGAMIKPGQPVLKDKEATADLATDPARSPNPVSQPVLKDKEAPPPDRPWIKVRLPRDSYDVERIVANWRVEKAAAPNLADAVRLYDAVLQGDIDQIRQIAPLLGAALQLPRKRMSSPVLDSDSHNSKDSESEIESGEGADIPFLDMVQAIADVTLMDLTINRRRIENLARVLLGANYTGAQLRDWYERWWCLHWWKGKDNHERPLPDDIKLQIGQVRALSPLLAAPVRPPDPVPPVQQPLEIVRPAAEPPVQPRVMPAPEAAPEVEVPAGSLIVSPTSSALAVPSANLEVGLLAYAVEASTGTDLCLNPAAKGEVQRLYDAGYRAEDVVKFLEKVWPNDWRGSDVAPSGKSKPRQAPTLKALVEGIARVKHKLDFVAHVGSSSTGQELDKRIQEIRRRASTGEPIRCLDDIRSQTWEERIAERMSEPVEALLSPPPRPEPPGWARDRWLALKGQLEIQLNRATFDTWVKSCHLVDAHRQDDRVAYVFEVPHRYAVDHLSKHFVANWQRVLASDLMPGVHGPGCVASPDQVDIEFVVSGEELTYEAV